MKEFIQVTLRVTDSLGEFAIWTSTRVLVYSPLVVIKLSKRFSMSIGDIFQYLGKSLHRLEKWYGETLKVYDSLPYGGIHSTTDLRNDMALVMPKTNSDTIRTLLEVMTGIEEPKELMILGSKGTGKSTIAQWLAYNIGGHIKVYEPEGTPEDWKGLEVIGKGEDYESINESMKSDLEHISSQMKLRHQQGDKVLNGSERVIIGEEYPDTRLECSNADLWLEKHAKRGRKARVVLILLSQYDRASAWGLEGRLDLLDCFYRLRLGKHALKHSKSLKDPNLTEWLKQSKDHALLDDEPILLPSLQERLKVLSSVSSRSDMERYNERYNIRYNGEDIEDSTDRGLDRVYSSNSNPTESLTEHTVQQNYEPSLTLITEVLKALEHGDSDNKILTELIMPSERVGKPKAKNLLEEIKKLKRDNKVSNGSRG